MSEQGSKNAIKRQVAYKVRINDLINGSYVKNEGEWSPNYIEINGKHISRVNLIGAIVLKPVEQGLNHQSIILDDGTGKIPIRTFEDTGIFEGNDIGDVVLVIGRPREFGSEKYIVPEILKKLSDHEWIKVRQAELESKDKNEEIKEKPIKEKNMLYQEKAIEKKVEIIEEAIGAPKKGGTKEENNPTDKIFNLIKNIDSGNGADTEEVVSKAQIKDAEQIIKRLLEEGEVFEVRPGKLKVLE